MLIKELGLNVKKLLINEEFDWNTEWDNDTARQLNSMIKYNNGLFKSEKQANFLFKSERNPWDLRDDTENLKKFFNIDVRMGEKAVSVDGTAVFSNYGARGVRPVTWYFVVDEYGIVRKYKLKYKGNMRDGTAPDPSKTELLWSRPEGLDTSHLVVDPNAPKEPQPGENSEWVGEVSKRQQFTGEVLFIKPFTSNWGSSYITKFVTPEGNLLTVFGGNWKTQVTKGDTKNFVGTVKKHDEYQGTKQTILNRVKEV